MQPVQPIGTAGDTADPPTTRRLTIELVPSPCWSISLNKLMRRSQWDTLRRSVYSQYGYHCSICGAEGTMNAHELWRYNDTAHVQRLEGIMAICSMCHHVKHLGLAGILASEGKLDMEQVIAHYCTVNACSRADFNADKEQAFALWRERSRHGWTIDFGDYATSISVANPVPSAPPAPPVTRPPQAARSPRERQAPR